MHVNSYIMLTHTLFTLQVRHIKLVHKFKYSTLKNIPLLQNVHMVMFNSNGETRGNIGWCDSEKEFS